MSDRFFLDTNIFIYSFDVTAPKKSRIAEELIHRGISTGKGVTSYQVVQEFFNVALRRFSQRMSVAEAEQYLSITFRPFLSVHSSASLYLEALRLHGKHGVSWYDAVILASALEADCAILYSEDFQDGRTFGDLRVQNPFAAI